MLPGRTRAWDTGRGLPERRAEEAVEEKVKGLETEGKQVDIRGRREC